MKQKIYGDYITMDMEAYNALVFKKTPDCNFSKPDKVK